MYLRNSRHVVCVRAKEHFVGHPSEMRLLCTELVLKGV